MFDVVGIALAVSAAALLLLSGGDSLVQRVQAALAARRTSGNGVEHHALAAAATELAKALTLALEPALDIARTASSDVANLRLSLRDHGVEMAHLKSEVKELARRQRVAGAEPEDFSSRDRTGPGHSGRSG